MKKRFTQFSTKATKISRGLFLTLFAVAIFSCNMENKLDGTTWKSSSFEQTNPVGTYTHNIDLDFSGNAVSVNHKIVFKYNNSASPSFTTEIPYIGTFSCDKKDITISAKGATWNGTVDKKTMTLDISIPRDDAAGLEAVSVQGVTFSKQ
ncbi:hypothetical protein LJC68_00405 [Bacteroidales bacterium OttesenSCG-928-B11]|nr:hypothetical protein [Bacteroidales bacterium OttesenSCG-928-B11]MDL2326052.1 hypothetical protein [Bacteroidales bacterium OttesenSCG-928-A14]